MIFDKIVENVMKNYYTEHKQGENLLKIDLAEVYDKINKRAESELNCDEEIEELNKTIEELELSIEELEEAVYND